MKHEDKYEEEFEDDEFEEFDEEGEELDDDFDEMDDFDEDEGFDTAISSAEGYHVMTVTDDDGNVIHVQVMTDEEMMALDEETGVTLNSLIDSTILKADATVEEITKLCQEAREYHFASVCVNSCWVRLCAELLRGSGVKVCTVVGFPLGAMLPEAKAFEAAAAIENGANEIDMVINIGALKSKDYRMVAKDISGVSEAVHNGGAILKVIIETCLLTKEEKIVACLLAKNAGADFVKTSTGFSTAGATVEDVRLMVSAVQGEVRVKAAGGIRTKEDAERMIEAGADRIGTSSGAKICGK